jgi:hypothetical protein
METTVCDEHAVAVASSVNGEPTEEPFVGVTTAVFVVSAGAEGPVGPE